MISKDAILETLVRFVREHGRYPSKKECKEIEWLYGWNTYWRALGRQSGLTILEDVYNEKPKLCAHCSSPLPYEKRTNKFCGHVCSAKHSNSHRVRVRKSKRMMVINIENETVEHVDPSEYLCACCGSELTRTQSTYCSSACQAKHRFSNMLDNWLKTGVKHENRVLRRFLIHLDGNKCSLCGIEDWNGKPMVFEVEHINGDSEDSSRENVCLICPNCHSQTDTYKGKNKGRGRFKRSQRYRDGKSY